MTLPRWCVPAAAAVIAVCAPVRPTGAQAPAQDPLCETVAPRLTFAISPAAPKKRPVRRAAARAKTPVVAHAKAAPAVTRLKRVVRKRRPRAAAGPRAVKRAPQTVVALPTAPRQSAPATRVCRPAALPLVLTGTPPTIAQIGPVPESPVEWPSTVQPQDSTGAGLFWWIVGAGAAAGGATTIGGGGGETPGGPAGVPVGPVVSPPAQGVPGPAPAPESEPTPGGSAGTPGAPGTPGTPPAQPPVLPPPTLVGTVPPAFPPATVPPGLVPPSTFPPPGGELPPGEAPPGGTPPGGTPPSDAPPGRTPLNEPPGGTVTQVVPEPGSLGLLLVGGAALAGGLHVRSRRR